MDLVFIQAVGIGAAILCELKFSAHAIVSHGGFDSRQILHIFGREDLLPIGVDYARTVEKERRCVIFAKLFLDHLALRIRKIQGIDENVQLIIRHLGARKIVMEISVGGCTDTIDLIVTKKLHGVMRALVADHVIAFLVVNKGNLGIFGPRIVFVVILDDFLLFFQKRKRVRIAISATACVLVKPPAVGVLRKISAKRALHNVARILGGIHLEEALIIRPLHMRSFIVLREHDASVEVDRIGYLANPGEATRMAVFIHTGRGKKIHHARFQNAMHAANLRKGEKMRGAGRTVKCAREHIAARNLLDHVAEIYNGIRRAEMQSAIKIKHVHIFCKIHEMTDIRTVRGERRLCRATDEGQMIYVIIHIIHVIPLLKVGYARIFKACLRILPRVAKRFLRSVFRFQILGKRTAKRRAEISVGRRIILVFHVIKAARIHVLRFFGIVHWRDVIPLARSARRKKHADHAIGIRSFHHGTVHISQSLACITSPFFGAKRIHRRILGATGLGCHAEGVRDAVAVLHQLVGVCLRPFHRRMQSETHDKVRIGIHAQNCLHFIEATLLGAGLRPFRVGTNEIKLKPRLSHRVIVRLVDICGLIRTAVALNRKRHWRQGLPVDHDRWHTVYLFNLSASHSFSPFMLKCVLRFMLPILSGRNTHRPLKHAAEIKRRFKADERGNLIHRSRGAFQE